ncbi:MAG: sugar isomerase domain-containing protein [Anaerolineae bacterium]|nr:sugar isomerase domain-containing protein [Anaerolineae bacterium]
MSAETYFQKAASLLETIHRTQLGAIQKAAKACAASIAAGRAVHFFGSGHSVLPVMDMFPRYGSYVGLHPIMDPRLMWFSVTGPGGARELLWLERTEGYVAQVLLSHNLDPRDSLVVYSHGGLNAAPVEMALAGKEKGLTVIGVTSVANHQINKPTHSSGHSLYTAADIVIDNCCPPEDALVPVEGRPEKVGASSTLAAVAITMALLSEITAELVRLGHAPERIFVSPNVKEVNPENNQQVFRDYMAFEKRL